MLYCMIFPLILVRLVLGSWSYNDIEAWSTESALSDTSYEGWTNSCGSTFTTQSPINIDPNAVKTCPSEDKLDWWLNAEITQLTVLNNGDTIVITPDDSNDYAKLKNNFKTDSGEHGDYKLGSLHLHWGLNSNTIGSEHTINGKSTVLEMHFLHYSTDYDTLSLALDAAQSNKATDPYILAVVAVLYTIGDENVFIQSIVDGVQSISQKGGTLEIYGVNIGQIVPNVDGNNIKDDTKFYYYKGSLTTPPCSPIVQWHVLPDTLTVSESQLAALRGNIYNEYNQLLVPNARPIQTNTNSVYLCGKN